MIDRIFKGVAGNISKAFRSDYAPFHMNWLQEKYFKHAAARGNYSFTYRPGITINFNDPLAFLHAAKEIFVDEIYFFKTNNPMPLILDCGGYIGMSALFFKVNHPQCRLIVFEPDRVNYQTAKRNISSWGFEQIDLLNKAVWINNDMIEFSESNDMASSIVTINKPAHTVQVGAERLRDYLEETVDFLKIDIEGAEYEVMLDIKDKLHVVQRLFVEYHGYYHQMNKLNTVLDILTAAGFNWYIKEAHEVYKRPFYDTNTAGTYDIQLNIFAFRDDNK